MAPAMAAPASSGPDGTKNVPKTPASGLPAPKKTGAPAPSFNKEFHLVYVGAGFFLDFGNHL